MLNRRQNNLFALLFFVFALVLSLSQKKNVLTTKQTNSIRRRFLMDFIVMSFH